MMKQALIYSLKVWLTTAILTTIFNMSVISVTIIISHHSPYFKTVGYFMLLLREFGKQIASNLFFLTPMLVGVYFYIRRLLKANISVSSHRRPLLLIGILLTLGPLAIVYFYTNWMNSVDLYGYSQLKLFITNSISYILGIAISLLWHIKRVNYAKEEVRPSGL